MTARATLENIAADLYKIAIVLADGDCELEFYEDTVCTTGVAIDRALPVDSDVAHWAGGRVTLTTAELREVYRRLVQMADGDSIVRNDLLRMASHNAIDEVRRDGGRRADLDGDVASVAHVKGLALALAQWRRWESEYQGQLDSWNETYAEAGSDHVFGGGSAWDANVIAERAAGPKPRRFWIHSRAAA